MVLFGDNEHRAGVPDRVLRCQAFILQTKMIKRTMKKNEEKDEKDGKKKRHPILDHLEDEIAKREHILSVLEESIERNSQWLCANSNLKHENALLHQELELAHTERQYLLNRIEILEDIIERQRTDIDLDRYMDAMAKALAMFPISTVGVIEEASGVKRETIKRIAKDLGIEYDEQERQEARKRLKQCGLDDIENRGGRNRRAVEVIHDGVVIASFQSAREAMDATGQNDIWEYIHNGRQDSNGRSYRYKEL